MRPALELFDLGCRRGSRVLFSGIREAVRGGHLLRVEGPNGSGKTTLLRTICGLATPEHGTVRWQGRPVSHALADLVYIGHAPALKDELSALENLQAACSLAGLACTGPAATAALAQAGLGDRVHLPARALSQGQRKRAGLARLLQCTARPLWVLDEPFDALDAGACAWLHALVSGHLARGGVAVLTAHQAIAFDGPQVTIRLGRTQPVERPMAACA